MFFLKPKASCTTPVNHWNEWPIQRSNTTLLVVKYCLSYHKFTYDSLGSITAVKSIELETAPKFYSVRECKHFTQMALVCQMSKGREIDEAVNNSWKNQGGVENIQRLHNEVRSQGMDFPKLWKDSDSQKEELRSWLVSGAVFSIKNKSFSLLQSW